MFCSLLPLCGSHFCFIFDLLGQLVKIISACIWCYKHSCIWCYKHSCIWCYKHPCIWCYKHPCIWCNQHSNIFCASSTLAFGIGLLEILVLALCLESVQEINSCNLYCTFIFVSLVFFFIFLFMAFSFMCLHLI